MAFYHLPHPYNPGYAIPDYVLAEPPGRGTFTTAWLPRGTISEIVPDFLAKPGRKLLGRDNAGLGGLGSLGDTTLDGTVFGGHSLKTPTLAGDTLGARKYTLESLGAADHAAKRAAFYEPQGDSVGDLLSNPWAWVAGIGAYLWWSSSKKGRSGGGGGGSQSISLGAYTKKHSKKKASSSSFGSLSDAERERRAGLMQNPRRRRRARRSRR